jgi:hypothetical protein
LVFSLFIFKETRGAKPFLEFLKYNKKKGKKDITEKQNIT